MSEGAHIVATVDATFQNTLDLNASLSSDQQLSVDLGTIYSSSDCKVLYNTSEYWNSHPKIISKKGYLYVYGDYKQDKQGNNLAGIKVGDGLAYLIDLPFMDKLYSQHIEDDTIHITAQERNFWNNKVRCYIDPNNGDNLIFTTQ